MFVPVLICLDLAPEATSPQGPLIPLTIVAVSPTLLILFFDSVRLGTNWARALAYLSCAQTALGLPAGRHGQSSITIVVQITAKCADADVDIEKQAPRLQAREC